jgi:His-Xaa-Ser system protein HxsD
LKTAYNFLDRGYFFFKLTLEGNILVQCTKKEGNTEDIKILLSEFSDELLSVYLRDKLEKDNKEIREKIVGAAIANSLDNKNFIEIDTDNKNEQENNQIDFDKDIEEILREIENDPDLKIDEEEIQRILKEIEDETAQDMSNTSSPVNFNINAVNDVKKKFQNR